MVGGNYGWEQIMGPVGGSGGWLSEKNSKIFFVPKELKSPKPTCLFFYPYLGGRWVGQTQIWIYPYFFFFIEKKKKIWNFPDLV